MRYVGIFSILFVTCLSQLEALKRDYVCSSERCTEEKMKDEIHSKNYYKYYYYCLNHALDHLSKDINPDLLYLIPANGPACDNNSCGKSSIYKGYLAADFKKYRPHLQKQLEYCSVNKECLCLWPECSEEAAEISDTAYTLFDELISSTALSNLSEDLEVQLKLRELIDKPHCCLTKHGLTLCFIAQQFRFSDYYRVCKDIKVFAESVYDEREAVKIKAELKQILQVLESKFAPLYASCYEKHPNVEIEQEIGVMELLMNDTLDIERVDPLNLKEDKPIAQSS